MIHPHIRLCGDDWDELEAELRSFLFEILDLLFFVLLLVLAYDERLQDIQDYDSVKAVIESGDDELIASEVVHAILDGSGTLFNCQLTSPFNREELSTIETGLLSVLFNDLAASRAILPTRFTGKIPAPWNRAHFIAEDA